MGPTKTHNKLQSETHTQSPALWLNRKHSPKALCQPANLEDQSLRKEFSNQNCIQGERHCLRCTLLAEVKIEVLLQRGLQVNWMVVARDLLAGTQKMKMGASGASEHGRGWRGEIANRFAIFLCSWDSN